MAKPKSEVTKTAISIKLTPQLKQDIQTIAQIYGVPFTVHIEQILNDYVESKRPMIDEQTRALQQIRERYNVNEKSAGKTLAASNILLDYSNTVSE